MGVQFLIVCVCVKPTLCEPYPSHIVGHLHMIKLTVSIVIDPLTKYPWGPGCTPACPKPSKMPHLPVTSKFSSIENHRSGPMDWRNQGEAKGLPPAWAWESKGVQGKPDGFPWDLGYPVSGIRYRVHRVMVPGLRILLGSYWNPIES